MNSYFVIAGDEVLYRSSSKADAKEFAKRQRRPCILYDAKPVGGVKAEQALNGATIHGCDSRTRVEFRNLNPETSGAGTSGGSE